MVSIDRKTRRILFLFYEPHKSGISRHIHYIIQALPAGDHEYWLICSNSDRKIFDYFHRLVPPENIITVPANRLFSITGLLAARDCIRRHAIDVVHIHNLQSILWGYGGALLAGCRKIVFTPHIDTECAGPGRWFFRWMWRFFNPFTSTLIALSHAQKKWLTDWKIVNEQKIVVISNHISERNLHESAGPDADAHPLHGIGRGADERFIVTQIGRLDRQKDPFFLIRVARLARQAFPEILFLLVGEGPLRKKIEAELIAHNLQHNVVLTGHRNDVSQFFEMSDIIALTSRWEGFPYVLLEAACFRKAVLATDIPGNREIVADGKNGFLIGSEQEFLEKLLVLRGSPQLRQQMGAAGYQMNRHLFDIGNMQAALQNIYTEKGVPHQPRCI